MQPRGPSPPVDPNRLHVTFLEGGFAGKSRRFDEMVLELGEVVRELCAVGDSLGGSAGVFEMRVRDSRAVSTSTGS